jgi:isocitrate/isopropylmalate dehydrogenase
LRFHFFKIELRRLSWRRFVDSANPVAAALLAKMGYNKKEKREMRLHYLRMLLKLRNQLDMFRFLRSVKWPKSASRLKINNWNPPKQKCFWRVFL